MQSSLWGFIMLPLARTITTTFAVIAGTLLCITNTSIAQGQPPEPRDNMRGDDRREPQDPQVLKERLRARLTEIENTQKQLATALARLEKGDAPADVMRDLGPAGRGGPSGPGGGPGMRGPDRREGRPEDAGRGDKPMRGPDGPDDMGAEGGPGERQMKNRGEGPDSHHNTAITEDERKRIIEAVRQHAPQLAKRLEDIAANRGSLPPRAMGRLLPRIREVMALRERSPEMFALRLKEIDTGGKLFDAVKAFRDADANGKAAAETHLGQTLREQFDIRSHITAKEIEMLSKRVEEMQRDLERSRADQDKRVQEALTNIKEGRNFRPDGDPRGGPDRDKPESDRK